MKNTSLIILSLLFTMGCAGKKNPVGDDLETIRNEGKSTTEMGPKKPVVVVEIREQATVNDSFLSITPDPEMSFSEGEKSSYKIKARAMIPGIQIELKATDLPSGAVLEAAKNEKDVFILSWTPPYYTVQENMKKFSIKLTAKISNNPPNAQKYKNLIREMNVPLFVFKNQTPPSGLKIEGLPNEVSEGTETEFNVTAKIPGLDNRAPIQPIILAYYDGIQSTAGNNFLEADGYRYIIVKDKKYLGDFNWEFKFIFDTKKIPVETARAKDGTELKDADGLRARFSLKIYNGIGLSTPESLVLIKIKYNKTLTGPKFDLSGVTKDYLEASLGETINLKFIVNASSAVTVTIQNSNLTNVPILNCQDSKQGANKQNCLLSWSIPCNANLENLNGEVQMQAVDSASNTTTYSLKTKSAVKQKSLCSNARKSI